MEDSTEKIVLAFDINKFSSEHIKNAAIIANQIMSTDDCVSIFNNHFIINTEIKSKMFKVADIKFEKCSGKERDAYSWTTRGDKNVHVISINQIFMERLEHPECDEQEMQIIITLLSICLVHEVSHLIMRWKGIFKTPQKYGEAGIYLEETLFHGVICGLISKNDQDEIWDSSKKFLGLVIERCCCDGVCDRKLLHYKKVDPNYVTEFYNKGLSTGLKCSGIFPFITCGPIDILHEFPLKSSVHENYKPPRYDWPENVYILPRNCPIDLERKRQAKEELDQVTQ